ncbi:MAG: Flp pilus assembly protein CpaB [Candidatus Omnitrophota bacterium]
MALVDLMENKKQVFIFLIAAATGLLAAFLVSVYVQNSINEQTDKIARKFQKDQKMRDEAYRQQMDGLGQKIIEVEKNAKQAAEDAAKSANAQLLKAEELRKQRKNVPLALRIPAGKRAITVMIESLGAVGGLVSPGDYVDIIAQLSLPVKMSKVLSDKDSMTAMIFQNIQLLAINTNIDVPGSYDEQQKDKALRITFAVSPEEASLLSFAEKNGKISLALRKNADNKPAMISAATWITLAEYVLQNTGADLGAPLVNEPPSPVVREKEDIQIFKAGRGSD